MDDNMEDIVDNSRDSSANSSDNDDDNDTFGDSQLLPRIGDQYQAEIPELMMKYDGLLMMKYTGLLRKPSDEKFVGLSAPIMWVHDEPQVTEKVSLQGHGNQISGNNEHGSLSESSQESQITSNDEDVQFRAEPSGTKVENTEEMGQRLPKHQPVVHGDTMSSNFTLPVEKETHLDLGKNGCCLQPGAEPNTWNDIEYDSFLLGLYIFGKNLKLVQEFVETKKMGDILVYYYGKFYRSAKYVRWSESRKLKTKRCIQGEKIFTGWRLNELLSRIISHVSEASKNMLIEVSRNFVDERISFEDYVFTLKDMVGVSMLVKAVAIGKGKQDLTGTSIDPAKTPHVLPIRPELPSGKECSSLTKGEIIMFLTGDYRLSKARSNDLFWEAVWPRLLARGWHSEQPSDHSYASKYPLVFLLPGVKKFSREKHVKGKHYFDSVSDVLNKVAAEPVHLELESEALEVRTDAVDTQPDSEAVNVCADKEESNSDPDTLPDRQSRYLQPHKPIRKKVVRMFTIVDTSLVSGGGGANLRALRSLPIDTMNKFSSALSNGTEQGTTEESVNKTEVHNTSKGIENIAECVAFADSTGCVISPSVSNTMITAEENCKDQRTGGPDGKESSKPLKFQFARKGKSQKSKNLEPVPKLSACKYHESSHVVVKIPIDTQLDGEESHSHHLSSSDRCELKDFLQKAFQNLSSPRSLAHIPEEGSGEASLNKLCTDKESVFEKTQPQMSIDLNLPHVPQDTVTDQLVPINDCSSADNKPPHLSELIDHPELLNPSKDGAETAQQQPPPPVVIGRRQSTRNRPMTTKALEAFAFESGSPKKKRKDVDAFTRKKHKSNSVRRVRVKVADVTSLPIGVAGENTANLAEGMDCVTNMEDDFLP